MLPELAHHVARTHFPNFLTTLPGLTVLTRCPNFLTTLPGLASQIPNSLQIAVETTLLNANARLALHAHTCRRLLPRKLPLFLGPMPPTPAVQLLMLAVMLPRCLCSLPKLFNTAALCPRSLLMLAARAMLGAHASCCPISLIDANDALARSPHFSLLMLVAHAYCPILADFCPCCIHSLPTLIAAHHHLALNAASHHYVKCRRTLSVLAASMLAAAANAADAFHQCLLPTLAAADTSY